MNGGRWAAKAISAFISETKSPSVSSRTSGLPHSELLNSRTPELLRDLTCGSTAVKGGDTPSHHEIACPSFSPWLLVCLGARSELEFAGYHDS